MPWSRDHPNCVQLFEVIDDEERDELYLVMEFIDGGDLDFPISKKQFVPSEQLRTWMRDVTLGLEYLHLMGITHRDIKPENLLLDLKSGKVKLADFGISSLSSKGGPHRHAPAPAPHPRRTRAAPAPPYPHGITRAAPVPTPC